ncbi:hypothetical protein Cgig2_016109 [Carnegiea gigantea]|uniref:Uncharacterized protein n=1 Tax=Carnegiea gigantea TaxID=171969 RepID=A0A9Q1KPZ2_9CARY|nr:hypothetical protein Cgig2_016109 [Carnegiea gigantea]
MGISITEPHYKTKKVFLFSSYILLGAASSCIFLTLSLRLIPSLCGFLFIFLHLLTIMGALAGSHAVSHGGNRWFGAHMVATVLTAIFQGSISVLIFTRSDDFLAKLKSYVREDDGVMILKLAGGLCVVIFCLEWLVLTLAFFLKYYSVVESNGEITLGSTKRNAKVGSSEEERGCAKNFANKRLIFPQRQSNDMKLLLMSQDRAIGVNLKELLHNLCVGSLMALLIGSNNPTHLCKFEITIFLGKPCSVTMRNEAVQALVQIAQGVRLAPVSSRTPSKMLFLNPLAVIISIQFATNNSTVKQLEPDD